MEKKCIHRGHTFIMSVRFNTHIERCPNGRRYHSLTVTYPGFDNYSSLISVPDDSLIDKVLSEESRAREYIDYKLLTEKVHDKRLSELGFK